MKKEGEIERHVRRQPQVEEIVGIERQSVRVAGQRLAPAVGEVPPRNLSPAKCGRGEDFDRIVGREVVAEKEETKRRREHAESSEQEKKKEPRTHSHRSAIIR